MAIVTVPLWQSAVDGIVAFIELASQPMQMQTRSLTAPKAGSIDSTETFVTKFDFAGAIDTAGKGKTLFDGSNVERVFDMVIYLEYRPDVTAEDWVLFDGRRIDILSIENIGEINGVLALYCTERGTEANAANEA